MRVMKFNPKSGETAVVKEIELRQKRENHGSFVLEGEGGQAEIYIVGGWDGREALKSVEVIRVRKDGRLEGVQDGGETGVGRNKPCCVGLI